MEEVFSKNRPYDEIVGVTVDFDPKDYTDDQLKVIQWKIDDELDDRVLAQDRKELAENKEKYEHKWVCHTDLGIFPDDIYFIREIDTHRVYTIKLSVDENEIINIFDEKDSKSSIPTHSIRSTTFSSKSFFDHIRVLKDWEIENWINEFKDGIDKYLSICI